MLLSLIGPDSFRRTQRLQVLRRGFMQKYDSQGLNIQEAVGKEMTVDDFRRMSQTGGLFSSKRLCIWHDPFEALQETREAIAQLAAHTPSDSVILFVLDQLPKKKDALVEVIQSNKQELFPFLSLSERIFWVQQTARSLGVEIEAPAAKYIAEAAGENLWLAQTELQKLAAQTERIRLPDVKQGLADPTTDSIFAFTDAFTARHATRALELMHEQLQAGTSPFQLLSMLFRQCSVLMQLQETNGQGTKLHPFVIKKNLSRARAIPRQQLQQAAQRLLADELKIKTGQVDPVVALDLFVIDWCR